MSFKDGYGLNRMLTANWLRNRKRH